MQIILYINSVTFFTTQSIILQDILSKRARTITHEEEKGSTFSKASFTTTDTATDISIDDPDFWKKWAKKVRMIKQDEENLKI